MKHMALGDNFENVGIQGVMCLDLIFDLASFLLYIIPVIGKLSDGDVFLSILSWNGKFVKEYTVIKNKSLRLYPFISSHTVNVL